MTVRRLQNKIAESRLTLPVVSFYGIIVCLVWGLLDPSFTDAFWQDWRWLLQVALLAVSTVLMVELNNSNTLIRVYSRMVSCSFLVLTLMAAFLLPSIEGSVVGLSFIVFYLFFLRAYQDKQAVGSIYTAFLAIGVGSLFFVQLLYFLPVLWLLMGIRLNAMGWRTFFASLLGLITPYWFASCYYLYCLDYETPRDHFMALATFQPLAVPQLQSFDIVTIGIILTVGFVVILAFTGMIHFLRQSSRDKLRTQMVYEIFIYMTLFVLLFLLLQPQHYDFLLRLLIVNTATLIGHFIALTSTKITNIAFFVILFLVLLFTAFHLLCIFCSSGSILEMSNPWISSLNF